MPTSTLFGDEIPATLDTGPDDPVTLATHFVALEDATITHLRFYKHENNTGTHVGAVYAAGHLGGTLLAEVTFTDETESGWQQQALDEPLQIEKGKAYYLCVHMPNGHWSQSTGYFVRGSAGGPGSVRDVDFGGILFPAFAESSYFGDDDQGLELGVRVTLTEETTIYSIVKRMNIAGVESRTLKAHIWSVGSPGEMLYEQELEFEDSASWAIIDLETPQVLPAGDYIISVWDSVGAYRAASTWFALGASTRYGMTMPQDNGDSIRNGVFDYNETGTVYPTDSVVQSNYWVDIITDKSSRSQTWWPTNGGSWGAFDYDGSGSGPAYPDQSPAYYSGGNGQAACYFIDAVFSFGEEELVLEVDKASHGLTSDSVTLIPHYVLEIDSARHGHTVDEIDLTQAYVLGVNDAQHAHSVDAITLRLPSTRTPGPDELVLVPPEDRLTLVAPEERLTIVH